MGFRHYGNLQRRRSWEHQSGRPEWTETELGHICAVEGSAIAESDLLRTLSNVSGPPRIPGGTLHRITRAPYPCSRSFVVSLDPVSGTKRTRILEMAPMTSAHRALVPLGVNRFFLAPPLDECMALWHGGWSAQYT